MKNKALSFGEFLFEKESTPVAPTREHLTDAQYAVMYLLFKGKTKDLPQPYRSMEEKDLRILAGLSDQTVRHRRREMAILAGGEDQALRGDEYFEEVLSKMQDRENMTVDDLRKTARLYLTFQEMPIHEVLTLALDAFTDDNKEKGEYYYNKNLAASRKYAQDAKQKQTTDKKRIQMFVSDMVRAYSARMQPSDARKTAIKMAAQKFGKTEQEITQAAEGK